MAQHTKGPYFVSEDPVLSVVAAEGLVLCEITSLSDREGHGMGDEVANAHLFAAAADMFEVCRKVAEAALLSGNVGPLGQDAIAALAKARGEA